VNAEPEDETLVAAAQSDRQAFGMLYDRYFDDVYHYIAKRVGDRELAEDLTGAVWERALRALPRYEQRGVPFGAWLYRIAGNIVANHFRRQRLRRYVPFVGQVHGRDVRGDVDDRSVVRQALASLSESDQEIIALHYYAGMTPAEISEVLDCSTGVVHKRLQRARERLRKRIEGDSVVGGSDG